MVNIEALEDLKGNLSEVKKNIADYTPADKYKQAKKDSFTISQAIGLVKKIIGEQKTSL